MPAPLQPAADARRSRWVQPGLTGLSLAGLILAGLLGDSAAKVGLGQRGWAPGALPWALGSGATTALVGTAYVLGGVGLWLGLRAPRAVPTALVMVVAAAEVAVGLAVVVALFREKGSINVNDINLMKW